MKNKKSAQEFQNKLKQKEERRKIKAKYKLITKENKIDEKKESKKIRKNNRWFNFFTKWFFIGLILVLLSICLSLYVEKMPAESTFYMFKPILIIVAGMLSTIGIALFVGCIFDFSKNSEAFVNFVSGILSDIVVSKNFLSTLSKKDKEQALNLILKPMDSQVEQYANINDFFKKKITESMTMFDTNFKTNVVLNVEARKDSQSKIVYCETTLTYTIYKLNNKFEPITVMCEKEHSASSNITIIGPQGKEEIKIGESKEVIAAGISYMLYSVVLPEHCEKYDHLTIKTTIREPGKDHWISYYWQSLTPYEGVVCRVKCYDNLTVKDFMIFDNKAYYNVDLSEDKSRLDITSSQWLNPDTGFCFVISE